LDASIDDQVGGGFHAVDMPSKLPAILCLYYANDVYFMLIKETIVFTRRVTRLLDDESYRLLQLRLAACELSTTGREPTIRS